MTSLSEGPETESKILCATNMPNEISEKTGKLSAFLTPAMDAAGF
jgi:hypothetical protein